MIEELYGTYNHMVIKKIIRMKSENKLPGVVLLDQVGIVNELYLLIQLN